jgi:hypothetical protein
VECAGGDFPEASLSKSRGGAEGLPASHFIEMMRNFTYWRDLCKNALSSPELVL